MYTYIYMQVCVICIVCMCMYYVCTKSVADKLHAMMYILEEWDHVYRQRKIETLTVN